VLLDQIIYLGHQRIHTAQIDIRVWFFRSGRSNHSPSPETPLDAERVRSFYQTRESLRSPAIWKIRSGGKECIVFLVNGQRQEAWDNTFIQRELGFKYLRTER